MNILLTDDDKAFLISIKKEICRLCKEKGYSFEITTTDEPNSILERGQYRNHDIILLDIEMPGVSGLELAADINRLKGTSERPYVIFVTGHDELVFDALKEQPYSFVRKSHLEDLAACLERICSKAEEDSVYIKSGKDIVRVELKDIIYMIKEKNYVITYTADCEYRERATIDEKAEKLLHKGFLRPHIGYLVNMKYIDTLQPQTIRLIDGVQIPLSKRYHKEVRRKFFEWMVKAR